MREPAELHTHHATRPTLRYIIAGQSQKQERRRLQESDYEILMNARFSDTVYL